MTRHVTERAAEWVQALDSAAPEQREAFVDWVRASPEHLREFLMAMAVHRELGGADWEKMAQVQDVLERTAGNVVHLPQRPAPSADPAPQAQRPDRKRRALISVAAAIAAGVLAWWMIGGEKQTYRTAIGEQRQFELADRSVVNLNSRSRIELRYSEAARDVVLEGEALFKVEHDPARPFRVHSGATVIQAVGTQFNVRRLPSGTTVSVIEGVVRVIAGTEMQLAAGEEARVTQEGRVEKRRIPEIGATATWQRNRLVFRDNTLEDIAAEFNRWNHRQIRIEGGAGAGRLYDGAFDADNPASLIEFLRRTPGLALEDQGEQLVIRSR